MNILRCILPIIKTYQSPLKYRLVISDTREVEGGESEDQGLPGLQNVSGVNLGNFVSPYLKTKGRGPGNSSMVECLLSRLETLILFLSTG